MGAAVVVQKESLTVSWNLLLKLRNQKNSKFPELSFRWKHIELLLVSGLMKWFHCEPCFARKNVDVIFVLKYSNFNKEEAFLFKCCTVLSLCMEKKILTILMKTSGKFLFVCAVVTWKWPGLLSCHTTGFECMLPSCEHGMLCYKLYL
jgi:hypothetical protein